MALGKNGESKNANKVSRGKLIFISALSVLSVPWFFFSVKNSCNALYLAVYHRDFIACFWPSLQILAARALPVDPTVLMILLSCMGIPGYSSATIIMGFLADAIGLRPSFILAPAYMAGLCICFSLAIARKPVSKPDSSSPAVP